MKDLQRIHFLLQQFLELYEILNKENAPAEVIKNVQNSIQELCTCIIKQVTN